MAPNQFYLILVRVQAGHYEQANDLAKRAMRIEVDELEGRPERLAELYFLVAFVKDEVQIASYL